MTLKTLSILLLLSAPLACGEDHHASTGEGAPTGASCPDGSTLTYASFGEAFMSAYCTRCHSVDVTGAARNGAPSDHNFDTPFEIRALAEHVDEYAGAGPDATNTLMPPDGDAPSTEEREQLAEWLACGAPE